VTDYLAVFRLYVYVIVFFTYVFFAFLKKDIFNGMAQSVTAASLCLLYCSCIIVS
jgi:hypothetical protein